MASSRTYHARPNWGFYDGVTATVDNGKLNVLIYLEFCNTTDISPHNILISKLERHGLDRWAIWWIRNWLDGCRERVLVNASMARWRQDASGVPQSSGAL